MMKIRLREDAREGKAKNPGAATSFGPFRTVTFGASVLLHYSQVLTDIHERGYAAYWAQEFQPYLRAAAGQFSPKHRSSTARWLKKAIH